ncbi:MAG TPA: hypothetical protein VK530_14525, partial [Candidatus Acidoferrum sp.]|nr:hypothetical protein [Candidatus Acidoferrum sp.]
FTAGGQCGSAITTVLQLQLNGTNAGNVSFPFTIGATLTRLNQTFESATPPALPVNWQTTTGATNWVTVRGVFNTVSNSVFVVDSDTVSDIALTSPSFTVSSTNAQLSFWHRYATEYGFDGGVLEISINNGPFLDILEAGGRFGANGYNFFIDGSFGNPLAGRDAWTGSSTNFVTTTIALPASASGKSVRLRWRSGSDSAVGGAGWFVDSILVTERACSYPSTLPQIASTRLQGSNVVFSFSSRNGIHYGVEYKSSLADSSWIPLMVQPGNGAMQSITNNIGVPQRFYRLREL